MRSRGARAVEWAAVRSGMEGVAARTIAEYEPARLYVHWWAGAPIARAETTPEGRTEIVLSDLRFLNWLRGPIVPFQMAIALGPDGRPLGHEWRSGPAFREPLRTARGRARLSSKAPIAGRPPHAGSPARGAGRLAAPPQGEPKSEGPLSMHKVHG